MRSPQAEVEAADYAGDDGTCEVLDLFQAFELFEGPGHGKEIYSLMRQHELAPSEYLDRFFDTGTERTQVAGEETGWEEGP